MSNKKPTFEEALRQLEQIAGQIERGEIGLEESIARYEQGMKLVKQCRDILANVEQRIQKLQEEADGTLTVTDFKPPDDSQTAPA